ncbi:acyltransferase domain-containing protein [Streptomonospora sp. NEAU-YY374]|nr:acyltransferase domain-containing protein [Streptomonospora nanhaiensis]
MRSAYTQTGIDPDAVGVVQAHGTGTRAGDRAEARALAKVFKRTRQDPLLVCSIKGAIGHLEGAAGLAGVAATALALHHGEVWPTAGHTRPDPVLAKHGLRVPTTVEPWARTGVRVAGVSAFGFGGTGAHAVLVQTPDPAEEKERTAALAARTSAPKSTTDEAAASEAAGPVVVPVSAQTPQVLAATAGDWARALRSGTPVEALASTAAHRRDHHAHRAAAIAATRHEAADALEALARSRPHLGVVGPRTAVRARPRIVYVFGGHGADHPAMATGTTRTVPEFAAALEQACAALDAAAPGQAWNPAEGAPASYAHRQQATWAHQIAMAAALTAWGLAPDTVIGHSLGEVAAAHTAGALPPAEAARLVTARSALLHEAQALGCLLAIGLSEEEVKQLPGMPAGAEIACINGPATTVVAGPATALESLAGHLEATGVWHRMIGDAPPAHSRLLADHQDRLLAQITPLRWRRPRVPMVSTVLPREVGFDLDEAYWQAQLREPVDFYAALAEALHAGPTLVVEVSPRPVLSAPITQTIARHGLPAALATAPAGADAHTALLHIAATAYTRGRAPTWPTPRTPHTRLPLPRWHHQPRQEVPDLADDLAGLAAEERRARLADLVRAMVAEAAPLPLRPGDDTTPLERLGVGSHDRILLRARLAQRAPALPAHAGTDPATTITDLTDQLDRVLAAAAAGRGPGSPGAAEPHPKPTAPPQGPSTAR